MILAQIVDILTLVKQPWSGQHFSGWHVQISRPLTGHFTVYQFVFEKKLKIKK